MRLESVTLHGFKSFGEKTVVKVLPGITAIVGPNGCGKTNLAEAVRWALGEQSSRSLRGQRMEDLIFGGSQSRKPVGLAEVELTFGNDGTLSVPWAEVSVARRLYRTGESEYLLNNSPSRLRDILDLFAGTGASPRAYSVMDQDKLNHVLTAKPHERRVFIEEAAGIARYKQQRNETQGKLDATRQNLVRVRDVMDEVKRQLSSLERQAKKARQYKALQTTKRDLALAVLAAEYMARVAEGERLAGELTRLRDQEQALRTRSAQLAAREARQRERLQESDHSLSDLRQSVQKVQGELERLLERREQMGVQLQELREEALRLNEEIGTASERLGAIVGERETARQSLTEASRLAEERARTADALAAALERHREALTAERERAEAGRLGQVRVAAERVDLMRHAGELREREAQLRRRAERLAAEVAEPEAEAARILALRASLAQARDVAETELGALAGERERLVARLAAEERRLAEAAGALANARVTLAARRSSLEALAELERAREGYGAGVRAVFGEGRAAVLAGVVGTVADLLEVPPGMERAIEAVLGERLQWVVVERFEHARAAVAYLQERSLGAATFLPLEHLPVPTGPLQDQNGVSWVALSVGAPSLSLVHYLLGQVVIVDHLDQAEALWRLNGVVATYVTPAGEVLGPTGRLHGGGPAPAADVEHSLLARKRQVRELEEEVRRLSTVACETQARVARLEVEVSAIRAELAGIERTFHTREADQLASAKDLEQAAREHERVHRHRETIQVEARQVAQEGAETVATLRQLEQRVALAGELRTIEVDQRAVDGELGRLIASIHEIDLRATECRVRREELEQEAWRAYGVADAALAAQHDPARDLETVRARIVELEGKLAAIGPVNLVADDEYRELDERLGFLQTQHDDLVASIKDLEKALRGMTRSAQERFAQAFQDVNRHFGELFERLFEGGRAELRLVEAEEGGDPLDTGVELMAQPRGKRLQSVTLLSGGERALTGLALLFAIFYFRPSPFCVLDEVDAPLDDANIHRFLRVLRELTSRTQFLVITHNRKTMEAADILYGVTMEEPGLSKLVSVNLNA